MATVVVVGGTVLDVVVDVELVVVVVLGGVSGRSQEMPSQRTVSG